MKILLGLAGCVFLAIAAAMGKVSIFGQECYYFGRIRVDSVCLSPGVFYALVIVGACCVAVALFLAVRDYGGAERVTQGAYVPFVQSQNVSENNVPTPAAASSSSTAAWKTLKEFDADIREAVAQLHAYGTRAEERLASAHLSINDKSLLPSIVAKIASDEKQEAVQRQEKEARKLAALSDRDKDVLLRREARARETIDMIRAANMTFEGRKVVSADMHDTDIPSQQGWAKVVYEDGKAELRAGSSFLSLG